MNLITRTLLIFLISLIAITLQNSPPGYRSDAKNNKTPTRQNQARDKRGLIIKTKPGPVRQIFGLIFEQWNDTRFTVDTINNLVNDQFIPENAPPSTTAAPDPNSNVTTKPPPFKITRSEFARILRRNLKGLVRLYNLELNDALKQSRITEKQFRKNVSREVSKFL